MWHLTVNSLDVVKRAFRNTFGKKGMLESDTDQMAEYMMSFFGFSDHVLDNRLASEDRDVFYVLEDEGFLTTTSEEVNIDKGKKWRLHYWVLKTDSDPEDGGDRRRCFRYCRMHVLRRDLRRLLA